MRTNRFKPFALTVVVLLMSMLMLAQRASAFSGGSGNISLTTLGSAYTQNFDTLATTGASNTLSINGWYQEETGTNAVDPALYATGTGSANGGDTYSFGAAANTERAFGGLQSGSLNPTIGASFTNNTGSTITSLDVAYTGEMWRAGATGRLTADRLDFQLSTDATSLATGTWADHDSLDFESPTLNVTLGALDGNAAANQTAKSFTLTGLNIANGATFWIRWTDGAISGSDDGLAVDNFSITPNGGGGDTAPTVTATTPTDNATNVAVDADVTVTFSEAVNVAGAWYDITCATSNAHTATVSGGPTTFTLNPDADFANGELCTVTIDDALVTDQDATDPPDDMDADYVFDFTVVSSVPVCDQPFTPIYDIQGPGATTPIPGAVTTEGVVVGDYEGASPTLRGFYLQVPDADVDADPATSNGIFVFNGDNNNVALGDEVRVTGTAEEFQDQTQIGSVTSIVVCGTGSVTPVDVTLPVASATFLEQYEGMLVKLAQTLYVTEHFQLGRFGQVVMSSGGRLQQPTNVVLPGAPAIALQAQNNLNRIIIDDPLNSQNPDPILFGRGGNPLSASNTLRGGDTASNIVGVMTYTWSGNAASGNAYRVRPVGALGGGVPNFVAANPRPAAAPAQTGSLRVGGMNVLNYFNTFDGLPDTVNNCTLGVGGGATDCRGADTAAEFARQWPKTVAALVGSGADVIGLGEIENDGYGPTSAIAELTDQLNGATAPGTYAFIDVDAETGQVNALGTDAIKVGFIYKPASVTPVGTTAALNTVAFVNGGDSAARNRPALAQAFEEVGTGARFIVVANHLKSKGSACDAPDAGDGQGNCNTVRTNAVNQLITWLGTDPTGTGDPDVLIVGDLNSYAKEDPITTLEGAGYINLIAQFGGANAYSYAFDGQWGYLDHALANAAMEAQVTATTEWHINADEPNVLDYNTDFKSVGQQASLYNADEFRMSDHDLALVDLNLTPVGDTTPPDTTITNNPPNPSNTNGAFFQYTSSEGGNQFECQLDGTGWTDCDGNQVTYGGLTDGSHTFEVRAIDAANNTDPTPASYTWVIDTSVPDTTPPDVTINQASGQLDPTGVSPINFTVVFSEPVADFATGDVTLGGTAGATTATVTGSGTTYNVAVSGMTANGTVIATIAAGVANDAAGNGNTASTSTDNTVTYTGIDTTAPTVTINQAAGQADPTSASPINFTVVFSEPVTGFATGDVTLGGTAGATTATVTGSGATYNVAVSGMTSSGTVIATVAAGVAVDAANNSNAASTSTDNTVTYNLPTPGDAVVFVSTMTAGNIGALTFGSEDILKWDGSVWTKWFDGSNAGLMAKNAQHNIASIYIPDPNGSEFLLTFGQNGRKIPGVTSRVDGMDIVRWNGTAFSLYFDGSDVGLTVKTQEKIDGLHLLDPALAPAAVKAAAGGSCQAYLLISLQGPGKIPNYTGTNLNVRGEDVLGFCATNLGSITAGKWHMFLDGSTVGITGNKLDSISISDDGNTLYFTTKSAFNVPPAVGGHSMVYAYDIATGDFSATLFSAPANGLNRKVDALEYVPGTVN